MGGLPLALARTTADIPDKSARKVETAAAEASASQGHRLL